MAVAVGVLASATLIRLHALPTTATESMPALDSFGKLPMQFEPNVGQTDPSVRFMAHGPGGTIYFTPSGMTLSMKAGSSAQESGVGIASNLVDDPSLASGALANPQGDSAQSYQSVLNLRFVGADPTAILSSDAPLPGRVNYLLGNDPGKWHTDVHTYAGITYSGLYPGVSLAYEGTGSSLKGTYTIAPNGNPSGIRWRYDGATNVSVDNTGNLLILAQGLGGANSAAALTLTEQAPVAWQEIGGRRVAVDARYEVTEGGSIGFILGAYDRSQPLVIDPSLILYSFTYLGGSSNDYGRSIAVDASGNTYITGYTSSNTFPFTPGAYDTSYNPGGTFGYDAFVTKMNANGSALVYSTYLGGSSDDYGYGIALDAASNAYVTGRTYSSNFPIPVGSGTLGGTVDAFVTKLNPAGNQLVYSRYLGGSGTEDEWARGIAVDAESFAYVTGFTHASNFPTTVGAYQTSYAGNGDAFVTKLAVLGTGSPIYSTYLGGSQSDQGNGIALDGADHVFITGLTFSRGPSPTGFPTTPNGYDTNHEGEEYDAFVTRLNTATTGNPSLVYSTYLGETGYDQGLGIAALGGYAFVTGSTDRTFPMAHQLSEFVAPVSGDLSTIVSKLDTNGAGTSSLIYSTYFGGALKDIARSIAVDPCGNVFIAGDTKSSAATFKPVNFIPGGGTLTGEHDGFVAKLSYNDSTTTLTLPYNTYLGGTGEDLIYGIALGKTGYVHATGDTTSTRASLPSSTRIDSYQANPAGGTYEGFVARIDTGDACITAVDVCACPMDVAFVLDTTGSMQTSLISLRVGFPDILDKIRTTSGGDYRLSLVTFKDDISVWDMGTAGTFQSWSTIGSPGNVYADMLNPPALFLGGGGTDLAVPPDNGEPEASDEALRTVLEERTSGSRGFPSAGGFPCSAFTSVRLQHRASVGFPCGPTTGLAADFGPWRLGNVRRIVVFLTDARPGKFTDKYDTTNTLPREMANLAGWRNIQVVSIAACADCFTKPTDAYAIAAGITHNYAYASNGTIRNGRYISTSQQGVPIFKSNGATMGDQLSKFIKDCDGTAVWNNGALPDFGDVPVDHPRADRIRTLAGRGVLGGYPCGGTGEPCIPPDNLPYFRPDNKVTRGQASKIVANAADFTEIISGTQQSFTDVPPSSPFYLYIERAAMHGVIGGYPCGGEGEPCDSANRPYFRPGNDVTRGQLSKIVSNAAGFTDPPEGQIYMDVDPSNVFYSFIMRLYVHDATNAIACGTDELPCDEQQQPYFGPNVPATRAETALFVANSFFP